tara:strand:+ start:5965 stop:6906 length:942 start_codon:yes stop_codon:yes gene_type:complete
MSDFAPSRFHVASGRNIVVCNDDKIKIIDDEGGEIAEYDLKGDRIVSSTAFGDFVAVSFSPDVSPRISELGILDIGTVNAVADTTSERFVNDGKKNNSIFKWDRRLEGFIEAIGSMEDTFIFSLRGLGIYSMGISRSGEKIEINENWRLGYPEWDGNQAAGFVDGVATITASDRHVQIISEGGEWLSLSSEDGTILNRGVLEITDPVYRAVPLGATGIFVMTRGSHAFLVDNDFNTLFNFTRLPGPVLDARRVGTELRWTGWRHDGRFDFETSEFETFPRAEIGLGVLKTGLCLYNDGRFGGWGPHSSSSSVV